MGKEINIYYKIKETGEEFRDKETIYIDSEIGKKYSFEKERMNKYGVTDYFPIYGVNNGTVSSERVTTSDGYRKIVCSGYLSNIETDNNWIIYYSETDPTVSDAKKEPLNAEMTTNTDNVRVGISDYPARIDSYIETSDTVLFDSITISTGTMSESFFTYGSTFSPFCDITMTPNSKITVGKYIHIEFTIDGVWQSFGTFYVNTPPVMTSEQMTVSATGLLSSILDSKKYKFEEYRYGNSGATLLEYHNSISITIPELINHIRIAAGVDVIFDFEDKLKAFNYEQNYYIHSSYVLPSKETKQWKVSEDMTLSSGVGQDETPTLRELLSFFAVIFHSNVIERNGKIHIVHNGMEDYDKDIEIFDESTYSEEPEMRLNTYYCPCDIKVECTQIAPNIFTGIVGKDENGEPLIGTFPGYTESEKEVTIMAEKYAGDKPVIHYPVNISSKSIWCEVTEIKPQYWNNRPWSKYPIRDYAKAIGVVEPFAYYPFETEFLGFNPNIYAGSVIKAEFNGVERDLYIGNLTISWDGMMSMQVSTPCDIETTGNGSSTSSSFSSSTSSGIAGGTMSAIITGQIFNDGAIENSKIKDSTITGSKFVDGTITGSKIADSTITGSLIANNTISGNKISENTITGNLIANNTLTGNLIKDGTITNNLIQDSTLTGAKIHDATISFEKVDESFIANLTADDAYIKDLTAKVASIGSLTADDAIIKNIQSVAISADYIRAITADIGYLKADEADLKYADITFGNIDTANIDKANIGLLFNEVGLIDRATIVDGHITGFLDAVEVNASKITAGTLVAERLLLKGSKDGLLFALNNMGEIVSQNVDTLDGDILTERTVTADKLVANSITANEIDASKTFTNELIAKTIASSSGKFINLDASQITAGIIDSSRINTNEIFVSYSKNYATIDENDQSTMFSQNESIFEVGYPVIDNGSIKNGDSNRKYIIPLCPLEKNNFSGGETIKIKAAVKYETASSIGTRGFIFFADNDGYIYGNGRIYSKESIIPPTGTRIHMSFTIKVPEEIARESDKYIIGLVSDDGAEGIEKPLISVSDCDSRNLIEGGITTGDESISSFGNIEVRNTISALNVESNNIGIDGSIVQANGDWDFENRIHVKDYVKATKFIGNLEGTASNANYAESAGNADTVDGKHFHWEGQPGQPSWLWGGNDGTNMYVYNPSNFRVNYATSADSANSAGYATNAGNADTVDGKHASDILTWNYWTGMDLRSGCNLPSSYSDLSIVVQQFSNKRMYSGFLQRSALDSNTINWILGGHYYNANDYSSVNITLNYSRINGVYLTFKGTSLNTKEGYVTIYYRN